MTPPDQTITRRIATLRWLVPLAFFVSVPVYQFLIARWVHDSYSDALHFAVEILFFGTTGPLLAFWGLKRVEIWLAQKQEAEHKARVHERRLAAITAASADAILSLDPRGRIESWNHGAELLFHYTAQETVGQPFTDLLGGDEAAQVEYRWLAQTARREGFVRGHETTCLRADGRRVQVELTATPISSENGHPVGLSLILRDITNRKQREAEIQRLNARLNQQVAERTRQLTEKVEALAQANAELQKLDQTRSEFVSLVSHQIRAPLTNVQGAVERMQADCATINPTCTRMFSVLRQQVQRLDRLVRDVLNANRIEAGELTLNREPISLFPVVRQVIDQTRARNSERPILLLEKPGLPLVFADRDRIAEVIANLLDNADKYSPPGAAITVSLRADQHGVTVSVRDHGPGLPPIPPERLFDKFYRGDTSDSQSVYGYGLGLYVCRQLIEAHGGHVWAENHPDRGAVFSFTLPVFKP